MLSPPCCWEQDKYNFKAHVYQANGFASKQDYQKVHGSDLYITDTEKYDQICKVCDHRACPALRINWKPCSFSGIIS